MIPRLPVRLAGILCMDINPYESPKAVSRTSHSPPRISSLLLVLPTGMLLSALLGAITNAINGFVSPHYFSIVMGWPNDASLWARSIFQGALEGLAYGLFFSVIFTSVAGFVSRFRLRYREAMPYVFAVCTGALATWLMGGLIGWTWACLDPRSYRSRFPDLPHEGAAQFGWVGGSIWGIVYGGFFVVIIVTATFVVRWMRATVGTPLRHE
jgi:hypothetical protein